VHRRLLLVAALAVTTSTLASTQDRTRRPLSSADIDDIAILVKLEDMRRADEAALGRILQSTHAEVRRRAAIAIGRIADRKSGALLVSARADADSEVAASVVFASGQLKDPDTVPWLSAVLSSAGPVPTVAREAAVALGKFSIPAARAALADYLMTAPATTRSAPVVGEALLSIGRFTTREDLSPIVRWTTAPDVEVRWRAAWALFRLRNPAALPHLLRMSEDSSSDVRFWAVRGLTPPTSNPVNTAPSSGPPPAPFSDADRARTSARLRDAIRDPDRRVRAEALRALGQFDDDASFGAVIAEIENADSWLAVSAAEAMSRFQSRAEIVVPKLIAASQPNRPLALRLTALTPLATLAPDKAVEVATALARTESTVARTAARQTLGRLGSSGQTRLDALTAEGVLPRAPAARPAPTAVTAKSDAEYRRLVERWIVPDYNDAPKPRAVWETPRGTLELELYPGDAPLGVEYFVHLVESGAIVGTEFGRVVPNFVAQQRAVRDDVTLRDEVNRRGLTRGNLSWASAGLDTGRPGYTLGNTPQPHNEGNFTALGRVVSGMEVVDRIELGDRITAARMRR
jgi:HEAT repeat protein/cyclophilin family peptidyl-prolyl cis-trans isomerase